MKRLGKFFRLTASDRRLLIGAALLLGGIRLGLWLLPFQILRRLQTSMAQRPARWRHAGQPASERIAWAVAVASRHVPKATCLTRAMAVQVLLVWEGYPARLCIGVARSEERRLIARSSRHENM